jgi:hypothetical protein
MRRSVNTMTDESSVYRARGSGRYSLRIVRRAVPNVQVPKAINVSRFDSRLS